MAEEAAGQGSHVVAQAGHRGEDPADFAIVYDEDQALARAYEVVAMPSSYVIGRDGQLAARHMGFNTQLALSHFVMFLGSVSAANTCAGDASIAIFSSNDSMLLHTSRFRCCECAITG